MPKAIDLRLHGISFEDAVKDFQKLINEMVKASDEIPVKNEPAAT